MHTTPLLSPSADASFSRAHLGLLEPPVEAVFQHMAARKLERKLRGTYKENRPWTLLWTFLTLLLIFGLVAPNMPNKDGTGKTIDIQVDIRDLGFLSLMGIIVTVFLVYTLTRVVVVVRWSLYWLMLTVVVLYFWKREYNIFSKDTPPIILIGFLTLEFLTFTVHFLVNYAYPPLLSSQFFRNWIGVGWWWLVRPMTQQPWTFTYQGDPWEGRRTCTYRGETDSNGLPHGFGHWLDDSFHGELLSGLWERGVPVGPFRSREFGSGYAFENLRVGFCQCTDDGFFTRSYFPTQQQRPIIGVCSVECSVAGGFFEHLPRARIRVGPYCLPLPESDLNPWASMLPHLPIQSVGSLLPDLKVLYTEHPSSSLIITAVRGGGVAVSGHSYPLNDRGAAPTRLIIDVVEPTLPPPAATSASSAYANGYHTQVSPGSMTSASAEQAVPASAPPTSAAAVANTSTTEAIGSSLLLASDDEADALLPPPSATSSTTDEQHSQQHQEQRQQQLVFFDQSVVSPAASTLLGQLLQQQQHLLDHPHASYTSFHPSRSSTLGAPPPPPLHAHSILGQPMQSGPYLRVRDWKSTVEGHVEALIFFPGFNASMKHSAQRLGQFMAMGRFPPHIKPFVFNYTTAREATYLWAVDATRTDQTQAALHAFLNGLIDSGIRDIHFLVHSLGAQTVVQALRDAPDGRRSLVSSLFGSAPPFEAHNNTLSGSFSTARLRTVTLLNPDCALADFVAKDFACIRRVCDTITVVGDRKDGALNASEMGNGIVLTLRTVCNVFRSSGGFFTRSGPFPTLFRLFVEGSCKPRRSIRIRPFSRVLALGRNIFSLYAAQPDDENEDDGILSGATGAAEVVGGGGAPTSEQEIRRSGGEDDHEAQVHRLRARRKWLDLDAIDCSSMDANVHKIRHSYFDLNKILVDDLNELIVTGKRAADRSLLLHREGNIFSFCQAPACVVNS